MNIFVVLQQMLVLLAMMLIGYFTCRIGWINHDTYSKMSKLVVNIFNPILIIDSVLGKSLHTTGNIFWQNLALVFLFYSLLFLTGILLVFIIRPNSVEKPIYRMMTLLPNIGFMGIPIVASLLGTDYVIYVAVYMLFYNVIIYTYGIALCKKSAKAQNPDIPASPEKVSLLKSLRPVFTNMGVISSIVALVLFFTGLPVPKAVADFCGYMGNPSIPLSMYLIGCSVAFSDIPSMLKDKNIYSFLFIKMFAFPIACAFLIRLLPFDAMILKQFVIMAAMPAGSLVVLVAEQYGGKTDISTKGVVLSTMISILSIPIVSLFL